MDDEKYSTFDGDHNYPWHDRYFLNDKEIGQDSVRFNGKDKFPNKNYFWTWYVKVTYSKIHIRSSKWTNIFEGKTIAIHQSTPSRLKLQFLARFSWCALFKRRHWIDNRKCQFRRKWNQFSKRPTGKTYWKLLGGINCVKMFKVMIGKQEHMDK